MLSTVEVQVSKEAYELGQGVAALIGAVKTAMADGFQAGQDLPVILVAAVNQLAAIEGADKIGDEFKENPEATVMAIAMGVSKIYGTLK